MGLAVHYLIIGAIAGVSVGIFDLDLKYGILFGIVFGTIGGILKMALF
ncbi:MAG: hypothetical protein ACOCQS_01695 [Bacillota bacterium]